MKPESLSNLTISANFAISADGKISSLDHRPSGWTSKADHQRLLDLRRHADAIFVGRHTLQSDNMSLTVPEQEKQPLRCIASASGNLTGEEKVFHTPGGSIHLWCQTFPSIKLAGVTSHQGSLTEFLETLHQQHGVNHLHCEGGGTLLRALLEIDCVDELYLTWAAHTMFGGATAPTIIGVPGLAMAQSQHFQITHFEPLDGLNEVFLSYRRIDAAP
jgi:riboflavin-specific deaminase-like protein